MNPTFTIMQTGSRSIDIGNRPPVGADVGCKKNGKLEVISATVDKSRGGGWSVDIVAKITCKIKGTCQMPDPLCTAVTDGLNSIYGLTYNPRSCTFSGRYDLPDLDYSPLSIIETFELYFEGVKAQCSRSKDGWGEDDDDCQFCLCGGV